MCMSRARMAWLMVSLFGGGALFMGLSAWALRETRYVPYVPVVYTFDVRLVVDDPDMLTEEHKARIMLVLFRYNEPFQFRGGVVYIQKRLKEDKDLLCNFTEKASLDGPLERALYGEDYKDRIPKEGCKAGD